MRRSVSALYASSRRSPARARAFVAWGGATGAERYTEAQLRVVEDLPALLEKAGPGATVPFQLRVLGRWFETRHEQTGEITNQPFDMLPHQVVVANRVLTSPPAADGGRHWLIADDVGLGKTIEAGMILEVMRHRAGGALRCLVVAPAGLVNQWQVELAERFGRLFERFEGDDVNKLQTFDQMVASIDTLKLTAEARMRPWKRTLGISSSSTKRTISRSRAFRRTSLPRTSVRRRSPRTRSF